MHMSNYSQQQVIVIRLRPGRGAIRQEFRVTRDSEQSGGQLARRRKHTIGKGVAFLVPGWVKRKG